jgi:hypothetical protein
MIRTILSIALVSALTTASLQAEPKKKSKTQKNNETQNVAATTSGASGWSYTNGVWTHIDGYKFVNGKVVRAGIQTHKKAPNPPTQAEMAAAMKKTTGPKTPAQIAAEKAAERERNLSRSPAPQTGSHF